MSETAVDPGSLSYPAYVSSDEERERWDVCRRIAETVSAANEPDGKPNEQFVWYGTRTLYRSEMPTGSADELEGAADVEESTSTASELLDKLAATKAEAHTSPQRLNAYLGTFAELLDELFGSPDDYDFAEFEGQVPPADADPLREAIAIGVRKPYDATLHPRARGGKWASKFNSMRAVVAAHPEHVRATVAAHVAGARLGYETKRAHMPGGAMHSHDASMAHQRHDDEAARLRAHAAEERNRSGIRGMRQQAVAKKNLTLGAALTSMAYLYSEEAERKLGPFAESRSSSDVVMDQFDQVEHSKEIAGSAHEIGKWALEHRTEIHQMLHAAAHVAHAVARAKGIAAADDSDPPALELVEWGETAGVADDEDLVEALVEPLAV